MKKSDVKKWVKALRSGEYQQGEGELCREDDIVGDCEYCCLGVACDILIDEYWIKDLNLWSIGPLESFDIPELADKKKWNESTTISFPSLSNLQKMGLDVAYAQELAELNDKGWSFKRIANKIEKDLL